MMDKTDQPTSALDRRQQVASEGPRVSPQNESPTTFEQLDENRIVKHIMVIGFHHKHGYQVDYCYPPLTPNGQVFSTPAKPISLPSCWRTLPLICLPDGSHNYHSDAIYFTMPDEQSTDAEAGSDLGIKTIFGTACYRQIQADKLLNRTDDMTRVAVQKSVCVLSTKPLFGLIRSKLEMITHAYFEELDFSKVKILKLTYDNLNSLLSRSSVKENATFLGLSARHLVSHFGCNMLVLFKAMLLERKILFYKSPVRDLCSTIMSMCSLFTGLLECGGLDYSTCDLQLSPALLEALKLVAPPIENNYCDQPAEKPARDHKVIYLSPSKGETIIGNTSSDGSLIFDLEPPSPDLNTSLEHESQNATSLREMGAGLESTGEYEVITESDEPATRPPIADDGCPDLDDPYAQRLCRLKPEDCGLPLQIFTRGSFCLPYLSISYLDLISDARVKSFVIGATNFLFKQRREMYDIIVDMEENSITINEPALKRLLTLSTEDLRFMDFLSRQVKLEGSQPRDEFDLISHDITKWVGGDEWIRYHFRIYTLYLLKVSKSQTGAESFNSSFVQAWKQTTNNYKLWEATGKASVLDGLQSRHPFSTVSKGLNFADMKLKLSYAVNSSEKGRMINQTLNGIGKWSIWNNIASNFAATSPGQIAQPAASSSDTKQPSKQMIAQAKQAGNEHENPT